MTDVYISGGSLPALAAAIECAEVGLQVRVLINDDERGIAGLDERGVPDPDGSLVAFLHHVAAPIAPGDEPNADLDPVYAPPRPVQLRDARGSWTLQPEPAVVGIPAVPMSARSLALLGGGGGMRASLDRIKPVLTIGKAHNLGPLVRSRLGRAALERLVEPCVRERYGVSADEVEVALVAPGLNEAMTRTGSLSGAALEISDRYVARETRVAPAAGWEALEASILHRLELYGAEILRGAVDHAVPSDGGWQIEERGDEHGSGAAIQVQAVVADPGSPQAATLAGTLRVLAADAWRMCVSVQVTDPDLPDSEHDALQTIQSAEGESWSLRLGHDSDGTYWARFSGPRIQLSESSLDEASSHAAVAATISELLDAAHLSALDGDAMQPRHDVRPAPNLTLAQRAQQADTLAAVRGAEPSLMPVGQSLHGGDLAAAVADARQAAVALRRRLTGIAD